MFNHLKQQQYEEENYFSHDVFHSHNIFHAAYLQPIITQYFIDNKSEIWLLFLIAHSKR